MEPISRRNVTDLAQGKSRKYSVDDGEAKYHICDVTALRALPIYVDFYANRAVSDGIRCVKAFSISRKHTRADLSSYRLHDRGQCECAFEPAVRKKWGTYRYRV